MKKRLIHILIYAGVFIGLIITLWMLLVASAALIPNEAIRPNMMRSAEFYLNQRNPRLLADGERWNSTVDYYTDVIWLHLAWNMGRGDPFVSALDTRYYGDAEMGENQCFYITLMHDVEANADYSHYWHGTVMALRLLSLFSDLNGIKAMGLAAVVLLVAITCVYLIKKKHLDIAVLMVLSLLAVQIWYVSLSVHYLPSFIITFLLCPFYIALEKKGNSLLVLLSVIGGTFVAFFDFLTTETTTILMPLILVVAIRAKEGRLGSFRENLPWLFCCGLAWLLSYAGTFVMKWTLLSVVRGEFAFAGALDEAMKHFNVETVYSWLEIQPTTIFSSVTANFSTLFGGRSYIEYTRAWIGIAVSVIGLGLIWWIARPAAPTHMYHQHKSAAALLMLLGAVVIMRYLILGFHSFAHNFFTYRALCSTIFAVFTALWLNIGFGKQRKSRT